MTLEEKLKLAKYLISKSKDKKVRFDLIYPFTTENINGYLSLYDLKNRNVLTVGSSSDQIINSFVMGAKEVDSFDINPFTEYYFNLKKAGIMELDLYEFNTFFSLVNNSRLLFKNENAFNRELFNKLSKSMDGETLIFWNSLYKEYSPLQIRKRLFSNDEFPTKVLKRMNAYLDEEKYIKLKHTINSLNPKFYNYSLNEISKHLTDNYDYILLSNISHYLFIMYNNSLNSFKDDVLALEKHLNTNGIIFFAYLYDMDKNTKVMPHWDIIHRTDYVQEVFGKENVEMKSFTSISSLENDYYKSKDSVLVYKK